MPTYARSTCLTAAASRSFSTPVAARGLLELNLHSATKLSCGLPRECHRRETGDLTLSVPNQADHARDQARGLARAGGRLDKDIAVELQDDQIAPPWSGGNDAPSGDWPVSGFFSRFAIAAQLRIGCQNRVRSRFELAGARFRHAGDITANADIITEVAVLIMLIGREERAARRDPC